MLSLTIGFTSKIFIMKRLVINQPDDWHVHFRDHDQLIHTVNATAKHFHRALVMPNLKPALTSLDALKSYRQRILNALPTDSSFTPYMTFYLNENVCPEALKKAAQIPYVLGAKYYPHGATTHAEAGAKSLEKLYPLLEIMQEHGLVLQIHGEVTHSDIFEREILFLNECLTPLIHTFPQLKIVLEHISTRQAVDYIQHTSSNVAATITAHHLLYNRNQFLVGGLKPHYYCLPLLKHERDQQALQKAATSGNPKFFAGTDSAPHPINNKENACGCAGIYSAPYALAAYAEVFDKLQQLEQLNGFVSQYGAQFYQLPVNSDSIELIQQPQHIPAILPLGHTNVVPIAAGEILSWSVHVPTS